MRIIKPSFEIWDQEEGLEGVYKQIERAGRVCYASDPVEGKAKDFVDRMIKLGHGAMLEHSTVYLGLPPHSPTTFYKYRDNKYSSYREVRISDTGFPNVYAYVSTNYRVLVQGGYGTWEEAMANNFDRNWLDDLKYLCKPTEYHAKRITVHFVCDRGVSHEFVRHRVFSFAQESTRYCNYSKDKFGNEITFIIPCWIDIPEGKYTNISKQDSVDGEYKQIMLHENNVNAYPLTTTPEGRFLWNCYWDEHDYFDLLEQGWKPQQARAVLPNSLKTELVMIGFISDWRHFFKLRDACSAHPQARELAHPLHMEFISRGYLPNEK